MRIHAGILVTSCAFLAACGGDVSDEAAVSTLDAVATVDGREISAAMFSFYSRSRAQKETADLTPDEREQLLDELIQLVLLSNAAESEGLVADEEFAAELELLRLQTIARRQIGAELERNPATEADLQRVYDENTDQLAGVQYRARHILVDTESEAQTLIDQLNQGADFQELARNHSTGPSGPNGGDLGWFSADRMVPPFAAAVRDMEVGSYTAEPVQTRFGWHVILLEEKSDARAPGLDAVRQDVTNMAEQQKIQEYLDQLRIDAAVEIDPR